MTQGDLVINQLLENHGDKSLKHITLAFQSWVDIHTRIPRPEYYWQVHDKLEHMVKLKQAEHLINPEGP